ncbi:MAG: serine hydrolase [Chromatiales bacterium]
MRIRILKEPARGRERAQEAQAVCKCYSRLRGEANNVTRHWRCGSNGPFEGILVVDLSHVLADTVFQLASMSKPLGSTVIAGLVYDGVVKWDDRVMASGTG